MYRISRLPKLTSAFRRMVPSGWAAGQPRTWVAPKLSSRRLPDGSIVSPSLEDMFPFLPPEEMKENIYEL